MSEETPNQTPETPDTPTDSFPPVATATAVAAPPAERKPSTLNKVLAWVGIVAGIVFIVATIFFSGFVLGAHSGGGHQAGTSTTAGRTPPSSARVTDRAAAACGTRCSRVVRAGRGPTVLVGRGRAVVRVDRARVVPDRRHRASPDRLSPAADPTRPASHDRPCPTRVRPVVCARPVRRPPGGSRPLLDSRWSAVRPSAPRARWSRRRRRWSTRTWRHPPP